MRRFQSVAPACPSRLAGRAPAATGVLLLVALLLAACRPAAAGTGATLHFPGNGWAAVSSRILPGVPGVLAARAEYVIQVTDNGSEPFRAALRESSGPLDLPGPAVSALRSGRARGVIRLAGSLAAVTAMPLQQPPQLQKGRPNRMTQEISPAEMSAFLDRVLQAEFTVQGGGRPLAGLVGPQEMSEEPPGSGRYRLSLKVSSLARLANPDSCQLLLFHGNEAWRAALATSGLSASPGSAGRILHARRVPGAGQPASLLLVDPGPVHFEGIGIRRPTAGSLNVKNAGSVPLDVPIRVLGGTLKVQVPGSLRLQPGEDSQLECRVETTRPGASRAAIQIGSPGRVVELLASAEAGRPDPQGTAQVTPGNSDGNHGGSGDSGGSTSGGAAREALDSGKQVQNGPGPQSSGQLAVGEVTAFSGRAQTDSSVVLEWRSPGGSGYELEYIEDGGDWTRARKHDFGTRVPRAEGSLEKIVIDYLKHDKTYHFRIWVLDAGGRRSPQPVTTRVRVRLAD